jgi:hypothetical protein
MAEVAEVAEATLRDSALAAREEEIPVVRKTTTVQQTAVNGLLRGPREKNMMFGFLQPIRRL